MTAGPWRRSLRLRLLAVTLLVLAAALGIAGLVLARLFDAHATRQFEQVLAAQLDRITAGLAVDAQGRPGVELPGPADPRFSRPLSGWYWQVDQVGGASPQAVVPPVVQPVVQRGVQRGVQRSRSLWDAVLVLPADTLADGERHRHAIDGPDGVPLLALERTVSPVSPTSPATPGPGWRLIVAADTAELQAARRDFRGALALSLGILGLLLALVAWAQVTVGLAPLASLRQALLDVHAGRRERLPSTVPAELQPLVQDFNRVLDRQDALLERARTQAGNLAHAVKTPLAVLAQAAAAARRPGADAAELAAQIDEQLAAARRQVDWHLHRARATAAPGRLGAQAAVAEAVDGIVRVMRRVHAERGLEVAAEAIAPGLCFAGEMQDLQEMVGNLVDNACKWARRTVRVAAVAEAGPGEPRLRLTVDDDGPGIAADQRQAVIARGGRLDEAVPGSGLGLAIVLELAQLHGGSLALEDAPCGGLRAVLSLPRR